MPPHEPGLLLRRNGEELTLKSAAEQIINSMQAIAKMLDSIHFMRRYTQILALQSEKIADASLPPSGQVFNDVKPKKNQSPVARIHSEHFSWKSHQTLRGN